MDATQSMEENRAKVTKIETRARQFCQQALAIKIESDEDAQKVLSFLNDVINPLIREGDELFDPMIAAALYTHRTAIFTKKTAVGALPAAKDHLRNELGRWAQLAEDRARQERLEVEKHARQQEEQRLERELKNVEDAAGPDAVEEVQAVLEAPRADLVLAPADVEPAPKIPGARDVYKCEVVNPKLFFAAIGDGRVPVSLAKPDQGALDKRASADKEGFNIPGCRLIKSKQVNSTRTR